MPARSITRLPPARPGARNRPSGTSGARARSSIATNAAKSAPAAASTSSVRGEPQPASGASTTAYRSATSASVSVTAPAASNATRSGARLSRSSTGASASSTSAMGMLMKKIARHPNASVSTPPTSSATVAPTPPTAPQTARALLRSASSSNVVMRIDSAVGAISAAETPWTMRAPTRKPGELASPQASDAAANSAVPAMSVRRRPSRSPVRPPSMSSPPNASR